MKPSVRIALFTFALCCAAGMLTRITLATSATNTIAHASPPNDAQAHPQPPKHRTELNMPPQGLEQHEWHSIRQAYEASRHRIFPVAGGHQARSPEQGRLTHFDGRGFTVATDGSGWRAGLALRGYGVTGAPRRVVGRALEVRVAEERISYRWNETLEEWFSNDAGGLAHGFTLGQRPAGAGAGLELRLKVHGGLRPRVISDGAAVELVDRQGQAQLKFAEAKVHDAAGRPFVVRYALSGEGLRVIVEEPAASYPLTIELPEQKAYLKASNSEANDEFGTSVAVYGDTVVVGAPGEDSSAKGVNGNQSDNAAKDSGAVYVFVRQGALWSQQAYLKASNTQGPSFSSSQGADFGRSVAIYQTQSSSARPWSVASQWGSMAIRTILDLARSARLMSSSASVPLGPGRPI